MPDHKNYFVIYLTHHVSNYWRECQMFDIDTAAWIPPAGWEGGSNTLFVPNLRGYSARYWIRLGIGKGGPPRFGGAVLLYAYI